MILLTTVEEKEENEEEEGEGEKEEEDHRDVCKWDIKVLGTDTTT